MAADDPVVLTESAYELLKEIVADYLSGLEGATNRPAHVERKGRRPEVYLARVRKPGITAFSLGALTGTGTGSDISDDVFGSGVCDVYRRLDDGRIIAVAKTVTVYNLSFVAVAEWQWILVIQDKSGTWWVVEASESFNDYEIDYVSNVCTDFIAQTSMVEHTVRHALSGNLVRTYCEINPNDCLCGAHVPCCPLNDLSRTLCITFGGALAELGSVTITYDAFFGGWGGAGPALTATCCSTSPFSDQPTQVTVTCDGVLFYLTVECGGGIGGNFLFHGIAVSRPMDFDCATATGSGTENVTTGSGPCTDGSFTYSIAPGNCPEIPGTGTGTGTGGSTSTPCCPAGLSSILLLTLNEDCLAGTYPITFDPTTTQWNYFGPPSAVCAGGQLSASLQCFGGNWVVSATCVRGTAVQTWQWTVPPTCTLPLTLTPITGVTSGGGSPCLSGLASLSGSIHT